jgi:hypothetical protein
VIDQTPPSGPYDAEIDIHALLIDERNWRLPDGVHDQRAAAQRMAQEQGTKLLALCKHVVTHGLNPAQKFLVTKKGKNYIVLDGNRRLVALRLLERPTIAQGAIPDTRIRQLKRLSDTFTAPRTVACAVFETREQADPWIELIHSRRGDGAGLVSWSARQKARHQARSGVPPLHLQVLDHVREHGALSSLAIEKIDNDSFTTSTLQRFMEMKRVRELLGVEEVDGRLASPYPPDIVLSGLTRLVDEIASGAVDSRKIHTVEQGAQWVEHYPLGVRPDPTSKSAGVAATLIDGAPTDRRGGATKKRSSRAPGKYLIPAGVEIQIPDNRMRAIYRELRGELPVEQAVNATGALLRVFLEMSLADFLRRKNLPRKESDKLDANFETAYKHMLEQKVLSENQLKVARSAIVHSTGGLRTLHAIVHEVDMVLAPSELRAIWGRLESFITALWA